jgi:hypothetical protein
MKAIRKLENQVAIHVRRTRKTVQEYDGWSILVSRFAIKHFAAINFGIVVRSHLLLLFFLLLFLIL